MMGIKACPKMINLIIGTLYLALSEFIDNQSLISIFKQIKILKSITENDYFSSNFASKLARRFPSFTDIELQVFSFDNCVST
ncbi:unnamed protein product, partial [Rotaria sp. Silwood1]